MTDVINNLPRGRNPNFSGREELLQQLRSTLVELDQAGLRQPVVLVGEGGAGKTELALEYAHQFAGQYKVIWWVVCDMPLARDAQYAHLAEKLGLPRVEDVSERVRAVRGELEARDNWLLVLDNVHHPDDVRELLPRRAGGHVVMTSERRDWKRSRPLPVGRWPISESVRFLLKRTGQDAETAAAELGKLLDGLPLALELAAASIRTCRLSLAQYVALHSAYKHDAQASEFFDRQPNHSHSLATTWDLSLRQLEQQQDGPAALELLNLCAFLAPENIALEMFVEFARQSDKDETDSLAALMDDARWNDEFGLLPALADNLQRQEVVAAIEGLSLCRIATSDNAQRLFIHRRLQAALRDRMGERIKCYFVTVTEIVARAVLRNNIKATDGSASLGILPHVLKAIEPVGDEQDPEKDARASDESAECAFAQLLINAAGVILMRGRSDEAREFGRRAMDFADKAAAQGHPSILANTCNNLAVVEQNLGNLDEARRLLLRAIEIDESAYERDASELAIVCANLADLEFRQGNREEARQLLTRAIAAAERTYGRDQPELAVYYSELARLEHTLGNVTEALRLMTRAIQSVERAYGSDHPELPGHYADLSLLAFDLRDVDEARRLLTRAVETANRAFEPGHPDLLSYYFFLAVFEYALDNLAEVRRLLTWFSHEANKSDHPQSAMCYEVLVHVAEELGKTETARKLKQMAHDVWLARLGSEHALTGAAATWLKEHEPGYARNVKLTNLALAAFLVFCDPRGWLLGAPLAWNQLFGAGGFPRDSLRRISPKLNWLLSAAACFAYGAAAWQAYSWGWLIAAPALAVGAYELLKALGIVKRFWAAQLRAKSK